MHLRQRPAPSLDASGVPRVPFRVSGCAGCFPLRFRASAASEANAVSGLRWPRERPPALKRQGKQPAQPETRKGTFVERHPHPAWGHRQRLQPQSLTSFGHTCNNPSQQKRQAVSFGFGLSPHRRSAQAPRPSRSRQDLARTRQKPPEAPGAPRNHQEPPEASSNLFWFWFKSTP